MKITKKTKAGALWDGKGYIQIGLDRYDIKIKKAEKKNNKSPDYKLVRVLGLREQFLCSLFVNNTKDNNTYLNGVIELGFGEMEVKIFKISDEKRKDKEKSPTSIIFGRLLMEDISEKTEDEIPVDNVDVDEEKIPF